MHLAFGASVVVMRRWDAAQALELIERAPGDHHAHGPGQLPAHPRVARTTCGIGTTCRALKLVVHAAAPCPVPLKRAFMDFVGRGQGLGVLRRVGGRRHRDLAGGVAGNGRAASGGRFPGNEFVILDDDGNELPAG